MGASQFQPWLNLYICIALHAIPYACVESQYCFFLLRKTCKIFRYFSPALPKKPKTIGLSFIASCMVAVPSVFCRYLFLLYWHYFTGYRKLLSVQSTLAGYVFPRIKTDRDSRKYLILFRQIIDFTITFFGNYLSYPPSYVC